MITILEKELSLQEVKKWKIIFKKQYKTKVKAMQEEYKLKKNYLLRSKIKKKNFDNAKI